MGNSPLSPPAGNDPPGGNPGMGGIEGGGFSAYYTHCVFALQITFSRLTNLGAPGILPRGGREMAELSIAGQEYRREGLIGHRPAGQEPGPKPELKKIRYTHDAVIDMIIASPAISQGELARLFGFSEGWLSVMVNCDAFQERLAERKAILVDPRLAASIEDRLGGLARAALDKLLDRMSNNLPISNGDLIAAAKLGVGDRNQRRPVANTGPNLYVVNIPPPSRDSQTWLNESSRGLPFVQEVNPLAGLMDPGGGA